MNSPKINRCRTAYRASKQYKCPHHCIWKKEEDHEKLVEFKQTGTTSHCKSRLKYQHTATDRCYIYWNHNESFNVVINRIQMDYKINLDDDHDTSSDEAHDTTSDEAVLFEETPMPTVSNTENI